MFYTKLIILYFIHVSFCEWVGEWMSPVQQKLASRRVMDDDVVRMVEVGTGSEADTKPFYIAPRTNQRPSATLKARIEASLTNAEELIERLQGEIAVLEKKEYTLKDAIANGRSGVSTVTVSTLGQPPRTYFVREGTWYSCKGMVQYPTVAPTQTHMLNNILTAPRCIGQEISSKQDPCAFNSVIKYETVPERRTLEYTEDDYFCLKPAFNRSLEQYLSVPKRIIKDTCTEGTVRSLTDNIAQCGIRMLTEYSYYPRRNSANSFLPLDYCTEKDGSCKLIVAWHVSNTSIENFEFLKNENNFKKYFIKAAGSYIEQERVL